MNFILQTFYIWTGRTRAWTITKNSTAPNAAGGILDFEKGFIRAETVSYEDFLNNQGWSKSKAGKMRLEGKDYMK